MKLGGWVIMLTVMILFLSLMGLQIPILDNILNALGIDINLGTSEIVSADIENSSLWNSITVIFLALVAGGAVVVGLFAKGYDTSLVILPFIVFLGGLFISTFGAIISYTIGGSPTWLVGIVTIIFTGLSVGFVMSCVDYFAGR